MNTKRTTEEEHVQPEERADSVGEELACQQPERQAILHDPWDKLRVGDCGAENAKEQINIFAIHRILSNSSSVGKLMETFSKSAHVLSVSSCAGQMGL